MSEELIVPTGIEVALLRALGGALGTATGELGKRLWNDRLSLTARRNRAGGDALTALKSYDFINEIRLSVILNALPTGISFAQLRIAFEAARYRGVVHELVAARVLAMPETSVIRVRENMQFATRLEFTATGISSAELDTLGGVIFDELDESVRKLVATIDGSTSIGLAELRQNAGISLLSASIDGISRHNSHFKNALDPAAIAEAAEWEATYRAQANSSHGYIEPPDFERKRKVPIGALFVSPQVKRRDDNDHSTATDIPGLYDLVDRTVLLGDPGGGKSTAAAVLAWMAANDPGTPVPFVVVLRTFADQQLSILEHLEARLSVHYQCASPEGVVEGILLSGRAIVIFDGLDELIDTSKRRIITERVELFCLRYPSARVLVTSRRVGYDEAAMDPAVFDVYELAEFSTRNVAKYVNNWFVNVEGMEESPASSMSESFITESSAVADLRQNPLMLALMCIIYRGQHWIPRNRPDVYEHCATLLFNKWDSSRQIYVDLKAGAYVDSAIKHLAYWMFTDARGVQGVTERQLKHEASKFLAPAFGSLIEAEAAAEQFVIFCRGRAWVLTDTGTTADGERLFSFTHRTFMEYFAAYELTRRNDGPERIAKELLPHVAAAEWEIVAELAVQISNKHSRDGAARILRAMLTDRRYRSSVSRHNIGAFAFRCLGFAHVPADLVRTISRYYFEAMLQLAADGNVVRPEASNVLMDLRQVVESEVATVLESQILAESPATAPAIELALELPRAFSGELGIRTGSVQARFNWHHEWVRHRRAILERCRSEVLRRRTDAVWFAAWRHGFILLEDLLQSGPRAEAGFPLEILFVSVRYQFVMAGWGDWGSFSPERLLQSGADLEPGFPMTDQELDFLGQFLEHSEPPWVRTAACTVSVGRGFDGDFLFSKIYTDRGWALFLLMLTGIELEGKLTQPRPGPPESKKYYHVMDRLEARRRSGDELPGWIMEALESLPDRRRALALAWLDGSLSFTSSA